MGTVEPRKSYLKSSWHSYAFILFIYSKLCEVPNRYGEKRFRVCMHSGASRLLGESSFYCSSRELLEQSPISETLWK